MEWLQEVYRDYEKKSERVISADKMVSLFGQMMFLNEAGEKVELNIGATDKDFVIAQYVARRYNKDGSLFNVTYFTRTDWDGVNGRFYCK